MRHFNSGQYILRFSDGSTFVADSLADLVYTARRGFGNEDLVFTFKKKDGSYREMRANPMLGYSDDAFSTALRSFIKGDRKDGHGPRGYMRVIDLDLFDEAVEAYETLYGPATDAQLAALVLDRNLFRTVNLSTLISVRGQRPEGDFLIVASERPPKQ